MRTLLNRWFLTACFLWLIFYCAKISGRPITVFNGHFTDFLAVPVIANLGLWFQRVFIIKNDAYLLKAGHVIFIIIYLSVVFEWFLPKHYPRKFTGDWVDVLLYILGGLFFYWRMNRPLQIPQQKK